MTSRLPGLSGAILALCAVCFVAVEWGGATGSDLHLTPTIPDSSLVDFSGDLDPPAGKHGFLLVNSGGHFAFEDGTPARFFGINVARDSVFQSRETIDRLVGVFARAGINLVRFHHMDERDGLIDETKSDTRHLREDRLRMLDYWIAELKKRGIYTYLDLLDYRTFKAGDGARNAGALERGGKPCAVFDAGLIELQKEYATRLLGRINHYSGRRYADEPAIAMIELFDENGLFRRTDWRAIPQPYAHELQLRWNAWIRSRHSRERRWPGRLLPLPTLGDPNTGEAVRFANQIHIKYYRAMRNHLRSMGIRAPLTAVGRFEELADLQSVADELDFIGVNYYWDHPFWKKGREWSLPSYFRDDNPIASSHQRSFAPQVSRSRMRGKPLVVREWNYCWPNRFRSGGFVEATAYASLQNLDALILFDYRANRAAIGYFDVSMDACRWKLTALLSHVFLHRQIDCSKNPLVIPREPEDRYAILAPEPKSLACAWRQRVERIGNAGLPSERSLSNMASGLGGPSDQDEIRSDTGQIIRHRQRGFMDVVTPEFVARAGVLKAGSRNLGHLVVNRLPEEGAVIASALDGKPLADSSRLAIAVSCDSDNEGQTVVQQIGRWALLNPGLRALREAESRRIGPPPNAGALEIAIGKDRALRVFDSNPTIELVVWDKTWYLQCTTPGVIVELETEPNRIVFVATSGRRDSPPARATFAYPAAVRHVEIRF